jgi:ABC-type proline/glycine betaine transport system ATPase subunit
MDLIVQLHKKIKNTIVLITHDDEVAKLSEKVYKVENTSLVEVSKNKL